MASSRVWVNGIAIATALVALTATLPSAEAQSIADVYAVAGWLYEQHRNSPGFRAKNGPAAPVFVHNATGNELEFRARSRTCSDWATVRILKHGAHRLRCAKGADEEWEVLATYGGPVNTLNGYTIWSVTLDRSDMLIWSVVKPTTRDLRVGRSGGGIVTPIVNNTQSPVEIHASNYQCIDEARIVLMKGQQHSLRCGGAVQAWWSIRIGQYSTTLLGGKAYSIERDGHSLVIVPE